MRSQSLLVTLFLLLTSCGFESSSQSNSHLLNKEETNEKDISKSEKTTEKISESVGEKTGEIPASLLTGFRKSGISEKIKVIDPIIDQKIPLNRFMSPEEQWKLDQELSDAVKNFKPYAVRNILARGGNPQNLNSHGTFRVPEGTAGWFTKEYSARSLTVLAILLGAHAEIREFRVRQGTYVKLQEDIRYPFFFGLLKPEDVLSFNPRTTLSRFISRAKNQMDKALLMKIYSLLHSTSVDPNSPSADLLMAIEINDLQAGINALNQGADPTIAIKHPDLLGQSTSFLPHLLEKGASIHTPINSRGSLLDNALKSFNLDLISTVLNSCFGCKYYYEYTASPEFKDPQFESLLKAVSKGKSSQIEKHLRKGITPNFVSISDEGPETLLMTSARTGNWQTVALLLKYGAHAHIEFSGVSALTLARKRNNAAIETLLFNFITPIEALNILEPGIAESIITRQKNADDLDKVAYAIGIMTMDMIDEEYETAMKDFDREKLKAILAQRIKVTHSDLYRAVGAEDFEIVKLMLQLGADPYQHVPQYIGEAFSAYRLAESKGLTEFLEEFEKWK